MAVELAHLGFICPVGKLKHRCFLVLGGERHGLDLIGEDKARGRCDLFDIVFTNRKAYGFRIAVLIGGNGIKQPAGSVPHLEQCARKSALSVSCIQLIYADLRLEHGVVDGAVVMLHVQFAVDGQRQLVRQHFNGFQRNGKLLKIIIAVRKRYGGLCNALIVRSQHLEEHIGGDIANVLSGVKSEHIALRKFVVEVELFGIKVLRELANLYAACAKLVIFLDGSGHDGRVLVLVSKRHVMDCLVHGIRRRRAFFLHGVAAKR